MKQIPAGAFKARCLAVMKKVQMTGEPVIVGRTCRVGEERHLRIHGGKSQNRGRYRVSDPG